MRQALFLIICVCCGCHPTSGPDKSVAGAVLGAGWGAGAGAVVGNQLNDTGPGALIGSGLGAGAGLLTGMGLDVAEGTELEQQRELDALQVQLAANRRAIIAVQDQLDTQGRKPQPSTATLAIFFDADRASLRPGSVAELERFAQGIKQDPLIRGIEVHGHSDDSGDAERNTKLSEARARSVVTFLANQGIALDQLRVVPHGAELPLASNNSEAGRQLNRRAEVVVVK